jgi:DNA-binding transcriptional LysR family regulator
VPRLSVEPNDERVAILDLERVPPRVIGIAWHRDRYRSPSGTSFVEVAREVCSELEQAATERSAA